jgi:hypothetical protein
MKDRESCIIATIRTIEKFMIHEKKMQNFNDS